MENKRILWTQMYYQHSNPFIEVNCELHQSLSLQSGKCMEGTVEKDNWGNKVHK